MKLKFTKKSDTAFIALSLLLSFSLGISIFVTPKKVFSEEENRTLSPFPDISVSSVWNGNFFFSLSDFYTDNIPLRRQMISVKALFEFSLGRRQNNDVVFLSDGSLADRGIYYDFSTLEKNLSAIRKLDGAVCVFLPRSIDVSTASPLWESESAGAALNRVYSNGVCSLDILEYLRMEALSGERIYYKTDHHLTTKGAYLLYRYISPQLGITPYGEESFSITEVCNDFLGTAFSSGGLIPTSHDKIELYRYEGDGDYRIICRDKDCSTDNLYDFSALGQKDKYRIFLGGNHGIIEITAENKTRATDSHRPKMLLIKDSFANALIPFLARHFNLTVVDPRYCNSPIGSLVELSKYDKILILCGTDTLATDPAFAKRLVSAHGS